MQPGYVDVSATQMTPTGSETASSGMLACTVVLGFAQRCLTSFGDTSLQPWGNSLSDPAGVSGPSVSSEGNPNSRPGGSHRCRRFPLRGFLYLPRRLMQSVSVRGTGDGLMDFPGHSGCPSASPTAAMPPVGDCSRISRGRGRPERFFALLWFPRRPNEAPEVLSLFVPCARQQPSQPPLSPSWHTATSRAATT